MPDPAVVVVGDANVDMVIRLPDRRAQPSDPAHFHPQLHGGGSAANTAVALARLGVHVSFAGALGEDGYGRWILEDFKTEGVDTCGVSLVKDAFTPMVMALIEPTGERHVAIWPEQGGAHFQLHKHDIDNLIWEGQGWLHTTGMCLRASPACEATLYAMQRAKAQNLAVSLDLNLRIESWGLDEPIRGVFERAISLSDVVFGHAQEEIIPLMGLESVEQAILRLSEGVRTVIARQGAQDAVVATGGEVLRVPAFDVDVVDTLGAGDAFNGGFIAARLAGLGVADATRWGHAAAAYKIGRVGARSSPTQRQLKAFIQSGQSAQD